MTPVIKDWDVFKIVAVPLEGAKTLKGVKRGRPFSIGEHLAHNPGPLNGDVHSPVNGLALEVNEKEIIIGRDDDVFGKTPAPVDFTGLTAVELAQSFKYLGLNIPEVYPGEPFIIQSFDMEPGLNCAPALFSEHRETMLAGLEALNALYPDHPVIWAVADPTPVPDGSSYEAMDTAYPLSLPKLVKYRINGRRAITDSGVFNGRDLYFLGRVWRTGLPVTRLPLTLGDANYFVPVGARIIDLLTFANLRPGPDDAVIKGGFIRGKSLFRFSRGLSKTDAAIHLIKGARRLTECLPCRGCGECSRVCPVGIDVAKAGRLPTDQWLDGRFQKKFQGCLECGVCALACPSRRPLLSLARLSVAGES